MRQNNNTNEIENGSSPSDDELIAYLHGSLPVDDRKRIEAWLSVDESHGERLGQYASIMWFAAETSYDDKTRQDRGSVVKNTSEQGSKTRYIIGLLALAATISMIIFSVRGFRRDAFSDERVAMAWAESLSSGSEPEPSGDMPDWLFDDGLSADEFGDASGLLTSDDLADDNLVSIESAIGFSSDEPPEWLLAAVMDMQTDGTLEEAAEVAP